MSRVKEIRGNKKRSKESRRDVGQGFGNVIYVAHCYV